jgi:uncharacterized protein with HEPN domain
MPPDAALPADDRSRMQHMLRAARDAQIILGDLDEAGLTNDMIRSRAVVNCFTEIGEAASRVTAAGRTVAAQLPWKQIVGMRNIVVHVYWGIDYREIVKTVRDDLPTLIAALDQIVQQAPTSE